jgi:hypothetical protein
MIGNETGLMGRIKREMDKENTEFYMELHCIIHQQSLRETTLKSEHLMKVVSVVNFIGSHGLDNLQFHFPFWKLVLNMGTCCAILKSDC